MNGRVLVDSNVLLYAADRSEPEKQRRAKEVLDHLALRGTGVLTPQVLGEFFVISTRKLAVPLPLEDACALAERYALSWPVLELNSTIAIEALRGVRTYQFYYWDAQLWAAARLNQIAVILSEDFNPGAIIEGVQFLNPFDRAFRTVEMLS